MGGVARREPARRRRAPRALAPPADRGSRGLPRVDRRQQRPQRWCASRRTARRARARLATERGKPGTLRVTEEQGGSMSTAWKPAPGQVALIELADDAEHCL